MNKPFIQKIRYSMIFMLQHSKLEWKNKNHNILGYIRSLLTY